MKAKPKNLESYPVVPLRDTVLFPGTLSPLLLGRPPTLSALVKAMERPHKSLFFVMQKTPEMENVDSDNLFKIGVVAKVKTTTSASNKLTKIVVNPLVVGKCLQWTSHDSFLEAKVEPLKIITGKNINTEVVKKSILHYLGLYLDLHAEIPKQIHEYASSLKSLEELVYTVASQIQIQSRLKQDILQETNLLAKSNLLVECLRTELHLGEYSKQLDQDVKFNIAKAQKEFFLNEQLKKIQLELGTFGKPSELKQMEESFRSKNMPVKVLEGALGEIKRLSSMSPASPEYSVARNYLDWLSALPWGVYTEDVADLKKVHRKLNRDHFGLKQVKERILEHVAVNRLSKKSRSSILCFIGPPGVGKTSLGKSIAEALGRKFVRASLGGVRDEAEIRGHRRTYIGSMPGRIIQGLKKCGSMNPVFLLDEIDKLGTDFRGDPAASLLEALDPEQNSEFSDHFIETGVDLSKIFFITTANVESNIPDPLRDRMEVIRLRGYTLHEKMEIAKRHLVPKLIDSSGVEKKYFQPSAPVIQKIIQEYTHESGVRQLEKSLGKVTRKLARSQLENLDDPKKIKAINATNLVDFLGIPMRQERTLPKQNPPGVVTGLAWTPVGGEILHVECKLLSGKGRLLTTGKLGEVMKESTQIAITLVRERLRRFKLDPALFRSTDIHIHLPEGAIPKDGPSAGLPITLAILSSFTQQKISPLVSFTGEVSLTGKVHAIGGLPEKSLAALQAGVTDIYLPSDNAHDVSELPKEARAGLKIHKIDHIDKVISALFKSPT